MRKSKNILLLILFLLCGVITYGQSITWDAAAGTIRCEGVAIGTTATVTTDLGDRSVEVVDRTRLIALRNAVGDVTCVCTSNITDMSSLLNGNYAVSNQDLSRWDTSNVTTMASMFEGNKVINQDLSNWDVSSVDSMWEMFRASNFNNGGQPLIWDTSSVTNMAKMFDRAGLFNVDISSWDVSSVENMAIMFWDANSFNNGGQPFTWDTSSVTSMFKMFYHAGNFNADIGNWDVSNVTSMEEMFLQADSFNNNGQPMNWDTSSVSNMKGMFNNANVFNVNIGGWDISNVTNMNFMLLNAISFNQNISEWCVNQISSEPTNFDTGSPIDNTGNAPRWDRLCTPRVVLTHTNGGNYLLGPGAVLTITATFDQDMAISPQYSIDGGSNYFDLTAGGNAATWTYLLDADSLPEGDHTFIVSGNGIDFDPSTHSGGAIYNPALGLLNGNETGVDIITYTIDRTAPTVVLNDDDADDLLSASDTVIVTANFSEAMNSAPTLSMSGLITNTAMTSTGDP